MKKWELAYYICGEERSFHKIEAKYTICDEHERKWVHMEDHFYRNPFSGFYNDVGTDE